MGCTDASGLPLVVVTLLVGPIALGGEVLGGCFDLIGAVLFLACP